MLLSDIYISSGFTDWSFRAEFVWAQSLKHMYFQCYSVTYIIFLINVYSTLTDLKVFFNSLWLSSILQNLFCTDMMISPFYSTQYEMLYTHFFEGGAYTWVISKCYPSCLSSRLSKKPLLLIMSVLTNNPMWLKILNLTNDEIKFTL